MGNITIPAHPGEAAHSTNAATGRQGLLGAIFNSISLILETLDKFDKEWLEPQMASTGDGGNIQRTRTGSDKLPETLLQAAVENENIFFRILSPIIWVIKWFYRPFVPTPIWLLTILFFIVYIKAGSMRGFVNFWIQLVLFPAALVLVAPGVIADLFFRNGLVDTPLPFWIIAFWRGFLTGLIESLYQLFTGRRWRRRAANAVENARVNNRARRAREVRERRQRALDDAANTELPETAYRTGREPRALRVEFGYWLPRVRVALGGLVLVGIILGVVYYCETLEAGSCECLGYDDRPISEPFVSEPGPPRFRYSSDGSRTRIVDL